MLRFKGVLITGASSGIGRELAYLLAPFSKQMFLLGRDKEALKAVQKDISHAEIIACDLADDKAVETLVNDLPGWPIDLLINSAGLGFYGPTVAAEWQETKEVIRVNIEAASRLTIAMGKLWLERGTKGTVLNISSVAGFFAAPEMSAYAASKAFLNAFSIGLDEELKPFGIRVLTSCPGPVATDFSRRAARQKKGSRRPFAMKPEVAARKIFWQIRRHKKLYIFDARYRFLTWFGKWLPQGIVSWCIRKNLKKSEQ